ncbi:MAG: diguanylate cyclase, partial [Nitrospirae bacterium]|nr:diguanylate cyclase [Nitrospirota bacterium]
MRGNTNILIVDDEQEMREPLGDILREEGYRVVTAENKTEAQKKFKEDFFNIVLTDLMLPDGTGLELLEYIKKTNAETIVIVLTGFASLKTSIQAMNAGAFSYIQKPVNIDEMKMVVKRALKVQKLSLDNKMLMEKLKDLSLKDSHTSLYNYHYFLERISSEFKRARRYNLPLSIIMIDIDHFKAINDVYGHTYGDIILKELAQCLSEFARGNDLVARYGGEEFVILLPDTDKEGALIFGKRLWKEIGRHTFDSEGRKIKIKVSMGISSYPEDGADKEGTLLRLVDQALLEAKERGGNRISTPKKLKIENFEEGIIRKGGDEDVKKLKNKLFRMGKRVNQAVIEAVYAFARAIEL